MTNIKASFEIPADFTALYEHATVGIIVVNDIEEIVLANPYVLKLFGYENDGLVGRPLSILVPQAIRKNHTNYHTQYFQNPKARAMGQGMELNGQKKDGTLFPVDVSLGFYNSNGMRLALAYIVDITERKKAQEKLKQEDARINLLIKHTPAVVAMFDRQMRYINLSKRWLEHFNLKEGEVIGRSHYEVFPEIPERWKEIHRRCMAGETLSNNEDSFVRADGTVEWLRWEICPWYESSNEIGGIIIFSEVITEQKDRNERYRSLFENSLTAMVLTDLTTLKVLDVNERGVKLFGYKSKEDLLENYDGRFHVVHAEEREENIKNLLSGSDGIIREMELKKLDGTRFWVKIFAKVNNNVAQSIIIDTTEVKLAQEELESKVKERTLELTKGLERERELGDMKSRFVSMASHEFRTPLTTILSSLFLIESHRAGDHDDKVKKHISRIRSSVKNLTDILSDFLSLDKLEQGKVDITKEAFSLPEFLQDIIDDSSGALKPGQHILFSHKGEAGIIQDKRILKNTILNLLSNAIKYSRENKRIYLTSEVSDNTVSISVRDEGIGIPEKEQKDLFEKFFRASNVTNIQGTGLGLNIVKRYAELMHAQIHFASAPEVGTTFTLEFPLKSK